jgi:hypothetical protein
MDDRFVPEWLRWTIARMGGSDCDASVDYRAVAVRPKPSTVGVTPTEIVAELT